jgi:hypothetical protein
MAINSGDKKKTPARRDPKERFLEALNSDKLTGYLFEIIEHNLMLFTVKVYDPTKYEKGKKRPEFSFKSNINPTLGLQEKGLIPFSTIDKTTPSPSTTPDRSSSLGNTNRGNSTP